MSDDKQHTGPIQPGSAGRWGEPVPFDQAVQNMLDLRREWASRPEEIERQTRIAEGKAAGTASRLRSKAKEVLYGPPDPRKGRMPMTR